MDSCVFCKIIKGEIPAKIIDENDEVIVFLSLQNHPLIVTKKHIEHIYGLDEKTATSVIKEAIRVAKAVKKGLKADGVNLIQNNELAAGQIVLHFHLHIRPRWKGDFTHHHFPEDAVGESQKSTTLAKIKSALD